MKADGDAPADPHAANTDRSRVSTAHDDALFKLVAEFLSKDEYARLSKLKTPLGVDLSECISVREDQTQIIAGDAFCYDTFSSLLGPFVQHKFKVDIFAPHSNAGYVTENLSTFGVEHIGVKVIGHRNLEARNLVASTFAN